MKEEIESAKWLENCAESMEEEGLDRDNNARHFRAGAEAIRYMSQPSVDLAMVLDALQFLIKGCEDLEKDNEIALPNNAIHIAKQALAAAVKKVGE